MAMTASTMSSFLSIFTAGAFKRLRPQPAAAHGLMNDLTGNINIGGKIAFNKDVI
jgi:hypothetical protein